MKPSTRTRFPRSSVLGVLLFVAVLTACDASCDLGSFDLGPFPENPFPDLFPEIRCADDADSGPIPTETTIPPGSEPLSGDAATLAAFYNATDGPNWSDNTNWLTDAPISDWSGVTASNIVNGGTVGECVVRRLYISFDRLSGEIPAELANLAHLEYLNLNGNQLSGMIPIELGKIPNLRSLDLSRNQLSGAIPAELGNLPNLEDLDLSDNQLSGAIPAELGGLLNLQRLYLGRNQLSGEIPAAIGNLPNMIWLSLADNRLSGEIPAELGNIPTLVLDGNRLTGRVLRPGGANPQYAWEGSAIRVSWDPVAGADHYTIYHDDSHDSACDLGSDGRLSFCEELATDVTGTTYVHTNPSLSENYYWVVSCNSDGCSHIDKEYPAQLIGPTPSGAEPGSVHSTPAPRATRWPIQTPGPRPTRPPTPTRVPTPPPPPTPSTPPTGTIPSTPVNVRFAHEDSTIHITWNPVDGADYYIVYHDENYDSSCRLYLDGSTGFCEDLATNVVGTTYVHTPDGVENYYWVTACNSEGCSEINSENPAALAEAIPTAPANARYAVEGSTVRVSWDPVAGADHYNIYHDEFFDSSCRLYRDGRTGFCEEMATNVVGTTYVHADPGSRDNYYWVVACNRGGCSVIDSKNPAKPIETRPNGPAAAPTETTSPLLKPTATESTPLVRDSLSTPTPASSAGDGIEFAPVDSFGTSKKQEPKTVVDPDSPQKGIPGATGPVTLYRDTSHRKVRSAGYQGIH